MDSLVDEELIGWLHREGSGQWHCVQMNIGDKSSGDPQGSILRPYCLAASSMTDSGTKCTPRKPAKNTKLYGVADMPEEWNAIQRDLDKTEK